MGTVFHSAYANDTYYTNYANNYQVILVDCVIITTITIIVITIVDVVCQDRC